MKIIRLWLICIAFTPFYSMAEQNIVLPLPDSKLNLIANYHVGEKDKPVIIVLHGFLQTKDFSTIQQLSSGLIDEGYSILRPTLSLGINRRKNSLSCEAIHTHHISDGVQELRAWVLWLKKQGHKNIVGLGHSLGNLYLLAYQENLSNPPLQDLILTSLTFIGRDIEPAIWQALSNKAEQALRTHQISPDKYRLSFCLKYITLPKAFLSYSQFNANYTANMVGRLKVPVHIIIGGKDGRIDINWVKKLSSGKTKIKIIEGANHFFDAEHEFDIQESILDSLDSFGF